MGILKGIFKSRDKPKNATSGSAYRFFIGGSSIGKNVNERSAMQMTAVYSCVRILSEAVASLPLHVYKYNSEGGKGEIIALYPLMPNRMTVDRDDKGQLYYQYNTSKDDAPTMKGSMVNLKPSDVLHIPGLGFDGLVGYSPIAMAKNAIGMAIACEEYGAKFFANGATPGGILEDPGTVKMRPWSAYTRTTQFQIENEKVTLTVSIGQTAETNNAENRGAYNLGKVYTFFRFSFENAQGFEKMEKYYIIARKIVAILTSQNNICFEEVYLSQRNSEQKYFKTGICKIFDSYENYSIRQWHKVIPIFSVFDYIPNLIDGIVNGKVNSLLELLPEDNKMVNRISIKNVQDLCTALEVSYRLDDKRKREKDALIEELKKNIKNTIAEFTKAHNEIDVNKETTMSSAFQYLDYTLKQKILTLYNENSDIVDEIVSKYSLPSVNENSIASFVKLRNNKTHSGTVEWGESAKIYTPLFAIVYASFFKYIKLPDEVIKSTLLQIF